VFFFAHTDVRKDSYVYFRLPMTMKVYRANRIAAFALTLAVIALIFMQAIAVLNLKLELRHVKWVMKTRVLQSQPEGNIQSFSFSLSEWDNLLKPDPTEFVFQGHYFDIAFVQQDNSGVVVKCLKDEKETLIKKQLKTWMNQKDSPYSKTKEKGNVYEVLSKVLLPFVSDELILIPEMQRVCFFKALDYSFIFSFLQLRPPIG